MSLRLRTPLAFVHAAAFLARSATVFIAAIPIAGIAAMKKVTVTSAPAMGLPLLSVSFTRNVLSPFRGGEGIVLNSRSACVDGAFIAAAAPAPGGGGANEPGRPGAGFRNQSGSSRK